MGRRGQARAEQRVVEPGQREGLLTSDADDSVQTRIEGSPRGRAAIAALVTFILVALLISNLPTESYAWRSLHPKVEPFLEATGLEQSWHLFAPEPRRQTRWLEAYITYRDGTVVRWHYPRGDRFISTYRAYRWQKWASSVLVVGSLWQPTATWIARTNQRHGEWPIQVVLVKWVYTFPGLDRPNGGRAVWLEDRFFIAHFPPHGQRRKVAV